MQLNDLLASGGLEPKKVLVFRHRPWETELQRKLPWIAAERPDLFNAYQQTHGPRAESALSRAEHLVSFLGHTPGKALFIGLYSVRGHRRITKKQFWRIRDYRELSQHGMNGFTSEERDECLLFDLGLTDHYADWKGRLVVGWPGLERSWFRWADRNVFDVHAITLEDQLTSGMPEWYELDLVWSELAVLPSAWKSALRQWRGIYLIYDESDGRSYVGSAYGKENLLGRWEEYATSGHGGNKYLKGRDPQSFRFTILQRVSPDLDKDDVIALENSWKQRLHTRHPLGLNDN